MAAERGAPAELLDARTVRAIREEIRGAFMWGIDASQHQIPPFDLDAERQVLASMLDGEQVDISPGDFFVPVHRKFAGLLAICHDKAAASAELDGWPAWALDEIDRIVQYTPVTFGRPLREMVTRVRELSRMRHAAQHAERARALLTTCEPIDVARAELRAALEALEER